jgi:hypothetical protein
MLELWLISQLLQDKSNDVFQHDGAPPHTNNEVTTFLHRRLPQQWIGRGGGGSTSWPLQSPDLTPFDFFLWGFVKNEVYDLPVTITLKDLEIRKRAVFAKVISLYCKMFHSKLNIVLMCSGQQMEIILNLYTV